MRADRFGSYSTAATLAGMPTLSRLKSIMRYNFLWPPPRCLTERRPMLFLPPVRSFVVTKLFSGLSLVMSSKVVTDLNRSEGVLGLNDLSPMLCVLRVFDHLLARF